MDIWPTLCCYDPTNSQISGMGRGNGTNGQTDKRTNGKMDKRTNRLVCLYLRKIMTKRFTALHSAQWAKMYT